MSVSRIQPIGLLMAILLVTKLTANDDDKGTDGLIKNGTEFFETIYPVFNNNNSNYTKFHNRSIIMNGSNELDISILKDVELTGFQYIQKFMNRFLDNTHSHVIAYIIGLFLFVGLVALLVFKCNG